MRHRELLKLIMASIHTQVTNQSPTTQHKMVADLTEPEFVRKCHCGFVLSNRPLMAFSLKNKRLLWKCYCSGM